MDYKIEGLKGLVTTKLGRSAIDKGEEVCITDEGLCFPKSLLPFSVILWIDVPQKALAILHIFYGDVKRGYELYKKYPYSQKGRICWIHKRLAKAVEQIISGAKREKVVEKLEGEVRRRWPNVCYEFNNTDLALSLVESLREEGYDVSLSGKDDELVINVEGRGVVFKKRDVHDHLALLELLSLKPKEAKEILMGLGSDESCEGLRSFVKALARAEGLPHVLGLLIRKAKGFHQT